jgi:Tfp pilus assembly protein PilE
MRGWLIFIASTALAMLGVAVAIIGILAKPVLDIYVHYANQAKTEIDSVTPKLEKMVNRADDEINTLRKETSEATKIQESLLKQFLIVSKKSVSSTFAADTSKKHSADKANATKGAP